MFGNKKEKSPETPRKKDDVEQTGVPYTYLLKCIPENKYYYGVRYANGCSPAEFWDSYFTSSKHVADAISRFGKNSFVFEIRKKFTNVDCARNWENRVLKRIGAKDRNDFYNKTDNISIAPLFGSENPATLDSTKQKIKETLKTTAARGSAHPRVTHPEKYAHIGPMLKGRSNTWSLGELNPMHRPEVKQKFNDLRGFHKNNGRIQSDAEKEKRRNSNLGKTRKKYECIHCGKLAAKNMLLKWHDTNCKSRKNYV